MKIFKNAGLTEAVGSLQFGKVEAGTSCTERYYIKNVVGATLENIKLTVKPFVIVEGKKTYGVPSDKLEIKEAIEALKEEIEIIKAPTMLNPFASGILEIKWSPSISLKKGLTADIEITADQVWD